MMPTLGLAFQLEGAIERLRKYGSGYFADIAEEHLTELLGLGEMPDIIYADYERYVDKAVEIADTLDEMRMDAYREVGQA